MWAIWLILLVYAVGVVLFTLMYLSWIGLDLMAIPTCFCAALLWPFDVADRYWG